MQEINLLQTRVRDNTPVLEKQAKRVTAVLSAVLIVAVILASGLFLLERSVESKAAALELQNQGLEAQLQEKQLDLQDAKAFQAQLQNVGNLLNNHIYVSGILDEIEKYTYTNARYVSMSATESGIMHVEGAVASYLDLGKLLLGLSTSGHFSKVRLLSVTPSTGEANEFLFSIDITASPEILKK